MKNKSLLTALAVLALGVSAQATTITFQENGSEIALGATSTFASSVTGYASAGETLFAKNTGPGERGLGLLSDPDHEINNQNFVQIKGINGFILDSISLGSVQPGEIALIWYSLVQGVLGVQIGSLTSNGSFDVSAYNAGYIGVSAGGVGGIGNNGIQNALPNVVLETAVGHVPDGASTMLLLGSALTGLGLLKRKLVA